MASRDNDQAARARADAFERELAERDAELACTRQALEQLREERGAEAARRPDAKSTNGDQQKKKSNKLVVGIVAAIVLLWGADTLLWNVIIAPSRCGRICHGEGLSFAHTDVNDYSMPRGCFCHKDGKLVERGQNDIAFSFVIQLSRCVVPLALFLGTNHLLYRRRRKQLEATENK